MGRSVRSLIPLCHPCGDLPSCPSLIRPSAHGRNMSRGPTRRNGLSTLKSANVHAEHGEQFRLGLTGQREEVSCLSCRNHPRPPRELSSDEPGGAGNRPRWVPRDVRLGCRATELSRLGPAARRYAASRTVSAEYETVAVVRIILRGLTQSIPALHGCWVERTSLWDSQGQTAWLWLLGTDVAQWLGLD